MEIELLYKKIEGELTPEEAEMVEAWLAQSPRHLAYFERLQANYHEGNDLVLPFDTMNDYRESFEGLLKSRSRRRRWFNSTAMFAAASCLIIAGIAIALFTMPGDLTAPPVSQVAEVVTVTEEAPDSIPVYSEKKTNRRVRLSVADKVTYGLSEISDNEVENVRYDVENGIVSYSRSTKEEPAVIHRLSTDPGAELCLLLEDGTKIWLNSGTEIEYPSRFCDSLRHVTLKGEAYFDVSKDSDRPFIVTAGNMDVKVYGTEFNVNTRRNNMTTTTLVDGAVAIIPAETGLETKLSPGETGTFDGASGSVAVTEEDIDLYIGWRQGAYHFSNESLESLFEEISLWYGIDVAFTDEKVRKESFSGIISRDMPLMDLLNILTMTNYVEFDLKGKNLTVKEKK